MSSSFVLIWKVMKRKVIEEVAKYPWRMVRLQGCPVYNSTKQDQRDVKSQAIKPWYWNIYLQFSMINGYCRENTYPKKQINKWAHKIWKPDYYESEVLWLCFKSTVKSCLGTKEEWVFITDHLSTSSYIHLFQMLSSKKRNHNERKTRLISALDQQQVSVSRWTQNLDFQALRSPKGAFAP